MSERFDQTGRLKLPEDRATLDPALGLAVKKDTLLLRQLYCQAGHPLVLPENPKFDGELGIKLLCSGRRGRGVLYLSPFHKDHRKQLEVPGFDDGEIVLLMCPECEEPLPSLAPHDCQSGAMFISLFLNEQGDIHHSASVCNAWGCYASFLRLSSEVITDLRASLSPFGPPFP